MAKVSKILTLAVLFAVIALLLSLKLWTRPDAATEIFSAKHDGDSLVLSTSSGDLELARGMLLSDVIKKLGKPERKTILPKGGGRYTYTRKSLDFEITVHSIPVTSSWLFWPYTREHVRSVTLTPTKLDTTEVFEATVSQ